MKLARGERVGQWTLQGPIGKGGNGFVWLAKNPKGEMAAIKFLKSDHFGKQRETRFRDEIKFLTNETLRPGILRIIDHYVPDVSAQEDGPWFATPFAKCFTELELPGVAKLPELVRHIAAIAQTLVKLHAENKWHRDLKPENLFLLDGIPVIGDFGLVDFPDKEPNTRDSETLGSRNYTAPELETDAAHTPAGPADVYSLSKTLWVLASGSHPPQGTLRMDTPELRFSKQCPHPRAGYFDRLLQNGTNYTPSNRPTMQQFAEELSAWLESESIEAGRTDLGLLARENESIFEVENKTERDRKERIQTAEQILLSFDPVLIQIATELSAFAKRGIPVEKGAYDLPGKFHFAALAFSVRLVSRVANQVKVTVTANHRFTVSLHSFVQVEALDDDTIRVVVGHLVQPKANGNLLIVWKPWTREATRPRGSAQLENESKALGIELLANLESAVREFVERIKKLQSGPA
jgi:serine/threonine protein kinase